MSGQIFVDMKGAHPEETTPEGMTDISDMENGTDLERNAAQVMKEQTEDIKRQQSPEGALNLPELLDRKRLQHGMIDDFFREQACFERIFIWQLPVAEKVSGSGIIMPGATQKRVMQETPKGILVSAGAAALDQMVTNGIAIGHTVTFIRQAPWRITCGRVRNVDQHLIVLQAGDVVGSEETGRLMREGKVFAVWDAEAMAHHYVWKDGTTYKPQTPWVGDDYR